MIPTMLLGLAALGLLLVGTAALGSRVTQDVAWHDLEEYCQRRKNSSRFDKIHNEHDAVLLGMENLRALGDVLFVISTVCWFGMQGASLQLDAFTIVGAMTLSILLFFLVSAWLPTALAEVWGTEVLYHFWPVCSTASRLVSPLSRGAEWMERLLRRVSERPAVPTDEEAFEDEVMAIVTEGLHDGHLVEATREMIEGVIELGDRNVADIMTPRSRIDAMKSDLTWSEALRFVVNCGRTRIPVHGEDLNEIEGILYVKDLLPEMSRELSDRKPWTELLREPRFASKSQRLNDLLQDFRETRNHLAMVQDEYGSTDGLVTIEDVLEEIVGEIEDESDQEESDRLAWIDDRTVEVQGDTHVAEVNERLGLDLPEPGEFETVAGFVISHLRRIPKMGECLDWNSLQFTVLDATDRRINRIRLEAPDRLHAFLSDDSASHGEC